MRIPQHIIDQVKQATDIVDLVGGYVALKLRGRNYVGLCPFHQEKTPSFTVNAEKQIFYCFGCGTGGDVIAFIRNLEKISYPEAIRLLAERARIEIPRDASAPAEREDLDALYVATKMAARFYYDRLHETQGAVAKLYLERRGFKESTLKTFGIGYAPDAWDGLVAHSRQQQMDMTVMEKAGLVVAKANGYYDRFRHRVMFPIINPTGRVIAFGGRQLVDDKQSPKYLNSPETPIFHKSKTLYGLYQARDTIRGLDRVLLVEGYADCISLHQYGFTNAVASCGTALTQDHAYLIRRYSPNVVLLYDGDEAGRRAAVRGGSILLEAGLNVRVTTLPPDQDPDSYVMAFGADALRQLLDDAPTFVEFRLADSKHGSVNRQSAVIHELMETLARIPDAIKQNLYLKEMAASLGISDDAIQKEWDKIIKRSARQEAAPRAEPKPAARADLPANILRAERDILRTLLTQGRARAEYVFQFLRPDDFKNPGIQQTMEHIHHRFLQDEDFKTSQILPDLPPDIQKAISRLLVEDQDQYDLDDCIAAIQLDELEKKREALRQTMKTMEDEKEDVAHLQEAWTTLTRHIADLKQKKQLIRIEPMSERPPVEF